MDTNTVTALTQIIKDKRLLQLSKESAQIYNAALNEYWSHYYHEGNSLSAYEIQEKIYHNFKSTILHSDSKLGIMQKFRHAITSYFKALKEYNRHPEKFTSKPLPPTKEKEISPIIFKKSAIKYKNNYLYLSLAQGNEPIKFRWDIDLGLPNYAVISYKPDKGCWIVSLTLKGTSKLETLDRNKIMGIDLGVKRTATTYDGNQVITYSGKSLKSILRLREKIKKATKIKMNKLKKHSLKYKKINRAQRKIMRRLDNKITDICHKMSRTIVNNCKENKVGKIVVGDCASTHKNTDLAKETYVIVQNPEQRVARYIKYKFETIGGIYEKIPEPYTSKRCPICGKLNEPNNRNYKCKCGFKYDRDGVGSINIWNLEYNVSFGEYLNVVGSLTEPIGWKYKSNRDCLIRPASPV